MRKIREVLRLKFEQGLSIRAIAVSCRVGVATVHEYLARAKTAQVSWPLASEITDDELEKALFPPAPTTLAEKAARVPDWNYVKKELHRKGVTRTLLWEEYQADHPDGYGYSQYCELYRDFSATLDPRMRQTHKAGDKLFVDYTGQTVPITDRNTGEVSQAQIFVAAFGASDYTFAEATLTQTMPDWIGSHVRAFEYFGGVPRIIVPDNLKTGVTSPHLYEPGINRTYQEMAEHYGVAVVPARASKPRDKAKAETHVQIVERWILARLRNRKFLSVQDLNEAMDPLLDRLNDMPFQKLEGNRRQMFEEVDRPALGPLPSCPYVFAGWTKARVHIDYHIEVDRRFYSVHYTYIGEEVDVRLTSRIVEIILRNVRIASHERVARVGKASTLPEHMPSSHKAHAEWTPERMVRWAGENGGSVGKAVEVILSRYVHPEQGFRSCLGIIRLGEKHGTARLEAACARMLAAGYPTYRGIKTILDKGLDSLPIPTSEPSSPPIVHSNIRGAGYYIAETHRDSQTEFHFFEHTVEHTECILQDCQGENHA